MFRAIKNVFLRKANVDLSQGTSVVLNVEKLERSFTLVNDGKVVEYELEREGESNMAGFIFKGKVCNIEHGLKAMFIDINCEKNAFLHFWDALPAALDSSLEDVSKQRKKKQKKKLEARDIPNVYPAGSDIMVQISKDVIGTKGPRVTTNISLPGRYLVLLPYSDQFGISRKIESNKERDRLYKIMDRIMARIDLPEHMGVIMRTVSEGRSYKHLLRDLSMLVKRWHQIEKKYQESSQPTLLFQPPKLVENAAHYLLTHPVDRLICDDQKSIDDINAITADISHSFSRKVLHYQHYEHIYQNLGLNEQIQNAFRRQVWLPCGGYIVIDETEALIAIDINTGKNRGERSLDKTILQTNLEAAEEIARQLRLRNIGGLVVVDFIDMTHRRDQLEVYKKMRSFLEKDHAKAQILHISPLGLMEMTRQRLHESLLDAVYETCPYCHGQGKVKNTMSMSIEIQRRLKILLKQGVGIEGDIIILVNTAVLNRFKNEDAELLREIERSHDGRFIFRSNPTQHQEKFAILSQKTEKILYQS